MIYYGAWTQGDDFERAGHLIQRANHEARRVFGDTKSPVDATTDVADICNIATTAAKAAATSTDAFFTALTSLSLEIGGTSPRVANTYGDFYAGTALISPSLALPDVVFPPDAIGIEWETDTCTAVGATWELIKGSGQVWYADDNMSVESTTATLTTTVDSTLIDAAMANYLTYEAPYEIHVADIGIGPAGQFVPTEPIDLTSYIRPDGRFLASIDIKPLAFDIVPADTGKNALAQTNFNVASTYILHPPRHRFIYDTPPSSTVDTLAPLRVVQRGNDGLGFTGGLRVVQGRSAQATNRRGAAIR